MNWPQTGEPLVICMAIGTSFGGHNGDSLLAGVLDGYALLRNRCVVTGTGNEAAQRHHYYGTFTEAQNIRTAEIRVGEGVKGFVTELWSTLPNIVTDVDHITFRRTYRADSGTSGISV